MEGSRGRGRRERFRRRRPPRESRDGDESKKRGSGRGRERKPRRPDRHPRGAIRRVKGTLDRTLGMRLSVGPFPAEMEAADARKRVESCFPTLEDGSASFEVEHSLKIADIGGVVVYVRCIVPRAREEEVCMEFSQALERLGDFVEMEICGVQNINPTWDNSRVLGKGKGLDREAAFEAYVANDCDPISALAALYSVSTDEAREREEQDRKLKELDLSVVDGSYNPVDGLVQDIVGVHSRPLRVKLRDPGRQRRRPIRKLDVKPPVKPSSKPPPERRRRKPKKENEPDRKPKRRQRPKKIGQDGAPVRVVAAAEFVASNPPPTPPKVATSEKPPRRRQRRRPPKPQ